MGDSYIFRKKPFPPSENRRRTVLVTGAAGRIGSRFCRTAKDRYDLRLMVRDEEKADGVKDCGEIIVGSLEDPDRLVEICEGVDTVVHLAADPNPHADWESVLPNNIEGTYHLVQAALRNRCRRFVYASSIHAISGYPMGHQVHADDPVNPGDLYGVSKAFGEALLRYAAEQQELSSIVVRIGACQAAKERTEVEDVKWLNCFVSYPDLVDLFIRCVEDDKLAFAIVHGLSDNLFNRMDTTSARELLGYEPKDDFEDLHTELRKLHLREQLNPHSEKGATGEG